MLCDHLTYLMVLDRQDHLGPYRCFFLLKVKVDCSLGRDILEECDCPDNVLLSLMDSGFYCNIYSCSYVFHVPMLWIQFLFSDDFHDEDYKPRRTFFYFNHSLSSHILNNWLFSQLSSQTKNMTAHCFNIQQLWIL